MDNYIVSARKYRPQNFDTVIGQSSLTTTLKNAIASGKLAHAYLFCGPRGVGKTTCARIFAKTINCLHPNAEGEACNECESCRAFSEQRSYNVHELDAASNNSVEDIRTLIEQALIPPQVGRYKVFIIDEVHMLSQSAFNAFLKTLEEPPAHAIFILATTEKHKILPTILSRCQTYDFARITVSDIAHHLENVANKEGITYESEALHVIAEKADGGMRDALSIFDQVASFCEGNITYDKVIADLNVLDYDEYFALTDDLLKCLIPQAMLRFNKILEHGFEGNYFIGGLASHFRNLLMSRDEVTLPLLDVSDSVRERYHEQALRCQPKFLYRALKLCNDCDINYKASRNKRLLVEITLIEVAQAASGDDDACGRRPARRIKPLFSASNADQVAAKNSQPAAPAETPNAGNGNAHPAQENYSDAAATPHVVSDAAPATNAKSAGNAATAPTANAHTGGQARPVLSILSLRQSQSSAAGSAPTAHTASDTVADDAPASVSQASPKNEQPFTEDNLIYNWYMFAQNLPKEQSANAGRMKNMKPVLKEGWKIEVEVDNDIVEEYMHRMLPQILSYLRTQLRNDSITLRFTVAQDSGQDHFFSRHEQFSNMLSRSQAFEMLKDKLSLELA